MRVRLAESGCMKVIGPVSKRRKRWAELIREQSQSGRSVSDFCREQGVSDQSFYHWRKRLAGNESVRFALVEADGAITRDSPPVELILVSGDRLRIAPGADAATLRTVLSVLRERA